MVFVFSFSVYVHWSEHWKDCCAAIQVVHMMLGWAVVFLTYWTCIPILHILHSLYKSRYLQYIHNMYCIVFAETENYILCIQHSDYLCCVCVCVCVCVHSFLVVLSLHSTAVLISCYTRTVQHCLNTVLPYPSSVWIKISGIVKLVIPKLRCSLWIIVTP